MQLAYKMRNYPVTCFTDTEFEIIFAITDDKKYGQLKRAVQKGDLVHIRRGLYCLSDRATHKKTHPFELAQKIYWPSYVSLESAFSYHGLIPEAVYNVTSVTVKRAQLFNTSLGNFAYYKLPTKDFFTGVERIQENDYYFFMAEPWKAITDYVYCYKKDWRGLDPLEQNLRIEIDNLPKLTNNDLEVLGNFYHSKRIDNFLTSINKELGL